MVEVNWQAVGGALLIAAGGGWTAWQWWSGRAAKTQQTQATEADFRQQLNGLQEAYASCVSANRKLNAELTAIRKVVGDPLPEPTSKAKK